MSRAQYFLMLQKLDADRFLGLAPGFASKILLKRRQPPLRRADEIAYRRRRGAHLRQRLLGWNAAIHHPDAVRLAVLRLDLGQKIRKGGLIAGVSGQHFVGQRKTLRRHNQRNHHLNAVGPLVAAIAILSLSFVRRIAFEISAGQIIEQHIEARIEQGFPAFREVGEQGLLVLQKLIQAAVELVALRQPGVLAQKIADGAPVPPLPMQPPLAARIDQPVAGKRFQDVQPGGSLPARRQALLPEGIKLQLIPEIERQPAGAPLPRAVKLEILQPYLHRFGQRLRRRAIFRKQGDLRHRPRIFVESLKSLAPLRLLAAADLAQIQHLPLDGLAAAHAAALNHTPGAVLLAVLDPSLCPQKHAGQ